MSTRKGKAWSVFPTQQMDSELEVTQVIVRPTDPHTVQVAKDGMAQSAIVAATLPLDPEISFYVPRDGAQIAPGDALEWAANHVDVTRADGTTFRVKKIGNDFDPSAPLH